MPLQLFDDPNGKEPLTTLTKTTRVLVGSNDRTSSLKVTKGGEHWVVFEHKDFEGKAWGPFTFGGRHTNKFFDNNKITSAIVYPRAAGVSIGKMNAHIVKLYEDEGVNLVTPSEISDGSEVSEGTSSGPGIIGDIDDAFDLGDFEDELEEEGLLGTAANQISSANNQISEAFFDSDMGKALKYILIITGIIVFIIIILLIMSAWNNRKILAEVGTTAALASATGGASLAVPGAVPALTDKIPKDPVKASAAAGKAGGKKGAVDVGAAAGKVAALPGNIGGGVGGAIDPQIQSITGSLAKQLEGALNLARK